MTKRQATTIYALSIAALVLGFLVSRRIWFRMDLTQDRSHTISAVSRNLRNEIPAGEQVQITYYISDKLSSLHPMPGEIADLLSEYASWSRGKIRLIRRDPIKANITAAVERMGIVPQQIQTVEKNQSSVATVYTGITIEYLDKIDVIPWIFSLGNLEYDITSRIRSMLRGTDRQIGILNGDVYRQYTTHYQPLAQALGQSGYRVRVFGLGEEIPASLPVLLVLGGVENLDEWSLYRIDYYIQNGGKVFFALDAVFVDVDAGNLEARVQEDNGLLAMVSYYGATVLPEMVLDVNARPVEYQIQGPNGALQSRITLYPHWFGVLRENANANHPVTANFSGLDLFWPSHISLNPPSGIEVETLVSTTEESWIFKDGEFVTNLERSNIIAPMADDVRIQRTLGVSLSGTFPSWFQGVAKPQRAGSLEELPDLPPSALPSRIIVIADTELFTDLLNYTRAEQNLDFAVKALDWLANDDELIGIRSRTSQVGRLDQITDPARKARVMGFAQGFNVVFLPLALIAAGILFAWSRRRNNASNEEHGHAL